MADEEFLREDELENRQGNLYPVGRALRRTFDAENHDSLGTDLTGLMLELARIDPDTPVPGRGALPAATSAPVATASAESPRATPAPAGWRGLVRRLLG